MCSTAQFLREIPHGDNADTLSILLAEQRHRTGLLCLIDGHHLGHNRNRLVDLCIYDILYLLQLLCGHRREMRKVKSCAVCILIRTLLLYVCAQHLTECLLK